MLVPRAPYEAVIASGAHVRLPVYHGNSSLVFHGNKLDKGGLLVSKDKSNVVSLYRIKSQGANKYAISLPRRLYKASQPIAVFKLGQLKIRVRCFPNKTLNKVGLSKNLIKKCGIDEDISCNLKTNGPVLHFGPVIGIFVTKRRIQQLVKKQSPTFRDIETVKANTSAKTLIYYFSIEDVRLPEKRWLVPGLTLEARNGKEVIFLLWIFYMISAVEEYRENPKSTRQSANDFTRCPYQALMPNITSTNGIYTKS